MQKEFSVADLIGYAIGIIAIIYAIITYYRSKLDAEKLKLEIDKTNSAFNSYKDNTMKLFGSLNDIAFGSLLRVKNFPADSQGLVSQRDSLISAVTAIQQISAREGDRAIFQGEYISGGELGAIEDASGCAEVWIVTQDLRPDVEEGELAASVAHNLTEGRRYFYIVPSDIPQELPQRLVEILCSGDPAGFISDMWSRLSIVSISRTENVALFANGLIALYVIKQSGNEKGALTTIGFDEVVLPNERRGSLWQRQPQERAKALMSLVRQVAKAGTHFDIAAQLKKSSQTS
jgi:hypothetical protein